MSRTLGKNMHGIFSTYAQKNETISIQVFMTCYKDICLHRYSSFLKDCLDILLKYCLVTSKYSQSMICIL